MSRLSGRGRETPQVCEAHTGPTPQSILMRILTEDPRPITEVRKAVPPNVGAAVARAVEKLPADRFASAGDFRDALRDTDFEYVARARPEAKTGVVEVAPPTPATTWLGDRRSKVAVGLLALMTVLWLQATMGASVDPGPTRPVTRMQVDLGRPWSGARLAAR